ncbi:hypothetical protein [Altererythrobacter sp. GH1-8]|uniref:hypothetical protein n=1 Tax=Altererythrobacter sp. GH1-8 TaxID=3349333 RepID=UPI00374CDE88
MPADQALVALDTDEIRAIRENIADARSSKLGPPTRILPETLCREIDTVLSLLERYASNSSQVPVEQEPRQP